MSASDVEINKFIRKELILLKICGLSLSENQSLAYRIYAFLILFVTHTYPFVQLIGALIYPAEVDFETIYCLFAIFLISMKAAVLLRKHKQIRKTLSKLGRKPFIVDLERGGVTEEELNEDLVWSTTIQRNALLTSATALWAATSAYSIFTRITSSDYHDWKLSFGRILVFDVTASPNFEIVWIYQIIPITYICMTSCGIDLVTFFVLCNVSYQFKFLQNSLRRIVKSSHNKMMKDTYLNLDSPTSKEVKEIDPSKIPWKYLKESLKEAISYHLAIISVAREMEDVFSFLFLAILFYTMVILCFAIYRLSLVNVSDSEGLKYVIQITFYFIQMAITCFWGEQVTYESQEVANAVYQTNCVGTDFRFQKGLMLIIERSQVPITITAAKFTDIRLYTYVWIARTTYACFMLLRNVNANERVNV